MTITRQTALWTTRGGLAVGAAVLLAACGSSLASTGAGGSQGGYGGPGGQGGFGSGQGFGPGASGQVEAVSGSTAQVRNTQLNEQVAVTWTNSTKFTQEVAASKAAVTVGTCVAVRAPQTSSSASASATARPTSIAAASVRITAPTNGTCTQGRGRFGGSPTGAPSGFGTPTGQPGSAGGQGRGFRAFGAFGKVTAVTATGFTVQSDFGGQTSSETVITTGSTTYLTTASATSAAVTMGACLQATGSADSTGAVTATRIALSQPVGGACTSGFGPRG